MSKTKLRVRFAPSPTGYLHLGGLRSALFNYLLARHSGGDFILRIEDTDRERLVPEAVEHIQDSLRWLGLEWNEGVGADGQHGPYIQSERLGLYQEHAQKLIDDGHAYRDYTSSQELEVLRKAAQKAKQPFRFTKKMAKLKPDQADQPHVVRFEVKPGPDVEWEDGVWGHQQWRRQDLEDFVALKSDGYPTYNFAVVIDDHLMEISDVLRGSEFLSTTPKNILVYEAFGWQSPRWSHLPPVLGPDKAKLSKRHGALGAHEYQEQGYLPEAVLNYLASLGFNDGTTREIYSADELIKVFDPSRIQTSPAIFDAERLDWMNGLYIRQLAVAELEAKARDFWPKQANKFDDDYRQTVLKLVQDRLKHLDELSELTDFFFTDPEVSKSLLTKQLGQAEAAAILGDTLERLQDNQYTTADLENALRSMAADHRLKTGTFFGLLRVALTGKTAAPGLFDTISALGEKVVRRRLESARKSLL